MSDTTDDITEGSNNLFLTEARVIDTIEDSSTIRKSVQQNGKLQLVVIGGTGGGGTALTDEQLQDKVAAFLRDGIAIHSTYDDTNGSYTIRAGAFRGDWDPGTAYVQYDVVSYLDDIYYFSAAQGATSSTTPDNDTNWTRSIAGFNNARAQGAFNFGTGLVVSSPDANGIVTISINPNTISGGGGGGSSQNQAVIAALQQKVAQLFPLAPIISKIVAFFAVVTPAVAVRSIRVLDGYSKVFDRWENDSNGQRQEYHQAGVNSVVLGGVNSSYSALGNSKLRLFRVRSQAAPVGNAVRNEVTFGFAGGTAIFIRRLANAWQINKRQSAVLRNETNRYLKSSHLPHRADGDGSSLIAPGRHASQVNWTIDTTNEDAGATLQSREIIIRYHFQYGATDYQEVDVHFPITTPTATSEWSEAHVFYSPGQRDSRGNQLAYTLEYRTFDSAGRFELQTRWNAEGNVPANGAFPWLVPQSINQYNTVLRTTATPARDGWVSLRAQSDNAVVDPGSGLSYLFVHLRPLRDGHDQIVPVIVKNPDVIGEEIIVCQDEALTEWDDLTSYLSGSITINQNNSRVGHAVIDHGLRNTEVAVLADPAHRDIQWLSGIAADSQVAQETTFDTDIDLINDHVIKMNGKTKILVDPATKDDNDKAYIAKVDENENITYEWGEVQAGASEGGGGIDELFDGDVNLASTSLFYEINAIPTGEEDDLFLIELNGNNFTSLTRTFQLKDYTAATATETARTANPLNRGRAFTTLYEQAFVATVYFAKAPNGRIRINTSARTGTYNIKITKIAPGAGSGNGGNNNGGGGGTDDQTASEVSTDAFDGHLAGATNVQSALNLADNLDIPDEVPDSEKVPGGGTTDQVLAKRSNTDGDTYWKDDESGSSNGSTGLLAMIQANASKIAGLFPLTPIVSKIVQFFSFVRSVPGSTTIDVTDGYTSIFDRRGNLTTDRYVGEGVTYAAGSVFDVFSGLGMSKFRLFILNGGTTNSNNNLVRLNNGSASVGFIRKTAAAWQINLREDAHPTTEHREYVKSQHLTARDTNVRNYIAPGRNIMGWVIDETAEEAGRTLQSRRLNIMFRFLYHTNGSFNRTLNFTIQNNIVTTNWVNTPSGVFIDPDNNLPYTLQHRFRRETSGARRAIIEFRWNPTGNLGANFYPELIADHLYQYNTYSVASNVPARDVWTNIVDLNGNVAPAGESWLTFALRPLFDGHDSVVPIIVNNAGAANETTIQCNDLNLLNWNDLPNYLNQVEVRRSVAQSGHAVTDHGLRHADLVTFSNAAHRSIKWLSGLATQHGSGDIYDYDKGANFRGDLTQNGSQVALQNELPADNELIPDGGDTNQVLAKRSNTDHDTYWKDETAGGGGSANFSSVLDVEPMRLLTQTFTARAGNISTTGGQPLGYQVPANGDGVLVIYFDNTLRNHLWTDFAELRGLTESVAGTNLANVPVGQRLVLSSRSIRPRGQDQKILIGIDANRNLLVQLQNTVVTGNKTYGSLIIKQLSAGNETFRIEPITRENRPDGANTGYFLNNLGNEAVIMDLAGIYGVYHADEFRELISGSIDPQFFGTNRPWEFTLLNTGEIRAQKWTNASVSINDMRMRKLVAVDADRKITQHILAIPSSAGRAFSFHARREPVLFRVQPSVGYSPALWIDQSEVVAGLRIPAVSITANFNAAPQLSIDATENPDEYNFSAQSNLQPMASYWQVINETEPANALRANWVLIKTRVTEVRISTAAWNPFYFNLPDGENEFILHQRTIDGDDETISNSFSADQLRNADALDIGIGSVEIRLAADGMGLEFTNIARNFILDLYVKEIIST